MKKIIWIGIIAVLSSCLDTLDLGPTTQRSIMNIDDVPVQEGAVDFLNLKIGQKSTFLRGEISSSPDGLPTMAYGRDTLILEVLPYIEGASDGDPLALLPHPSKFYFKETGRGSGGVSSFSTTYLVEQLVDGVLIPEREGSALFFFYNNDKLTFLPQESDEEFQVEQAGLNIQFKGTNTIFEGDLVGLVDQFQIESISFQENPDQAPATINWLDKAAIACRPVSLPGNGYLIYDYHQLYMSYDYGIGIMNSGQEVHGGFAFVLADLVAIPD